MGDWTTAPLGEIADIKTGKLDSNAAVEGAQYPYFTCSPKTLTIATYAFDCNAVLLAGNNANGIFCVKHYNGKFNAYQRTYVITSKDERRLSVGFLFYFIKTLSVHLTAFSSGTATKFLTRKILDSVPVPLPPERQQQAIASLLSALDDKIKLNCQTNETLEALARAIFKDWFVDFGPTRAKAEGQEPYLAPELWDLFPDVLDDEDTPDGWVWSTIGNEATTVLGGTPSRLKPEYWNGHIPWINSGKANEFRVIAPSENITEQGLKKSATKFLPKRTTLVAITGATLGQVSLNEIETCANQSIVGVIGNNTMPSEFLYLWVSEKIGDLIACQTGGAQQHINKRNVNDLPILIAAQAVINKWLELARPIFDKIADNCFEGAILAQTRDLLLPKLMSGEIRLQDAERSVGEVV